MRLKKREITDLDEILNVLERCSVIRLGINSDAHPYVVPMNFGYQVREGKLYLYVHGAKDGLKHELLAKDSRVCVEGDIFNGYDVTNHGITSRYESIIGVGCAERVSGDEAYRGLELLLEHCGFSKSFCENCTMTDAVTVYRISIESITGKRN